MALFLASHGVTPSVQPQSARELGLGPGESGVGLGSVGLESVSLGHHLLEEAIWERIGSGSLGGIAGCGESYGSCDVAAWIRCVFGRAGWVGDCVVGLLGAVMGGVDRESGFFDFVQQTVGELDGGEKGVGDGALDAVSGESLDDLIDSGQHGGFVEKRGQVKRLEVARFSFVLVFAS